MQIKKCTVDEAAAVGEFYDAVVKFMYDNNVNYPKWLYKIFPSAKYALNAARAGTQFICTDECNVHVEERDGFAVVATSDRIPVGCNVTLPDGEKICAAFVLCEDPEGDYSKVTWSQDLAVGEYLVLHAFSVAPDCQRRGLGKKIIEYCANYAAEKNYRALRLDIVPGNFPAKKLYEACGFKFVGAADLRREFSGIPEFCCYERNF